MKKALQDAITEAVKPPFRVFDPLNEEHLLVPGTKVRWKDEAFDCVRNAEVVGLHENGWSCWVDEGRGQILVNLCHFVAIKEDPMGSNRRENAPRAEPEQPAKKAVTAEDVVRAYTCTKERIKAEFSAYAARVDEAKKLLDDALAPLEVVQEKREQWLSTKGRLTADSIISDYIETRDAIDEEKRAYEERVANLKAVQAKREHWLTYELDKLKLTSFKKTGVGIAFFKTRTSATMADVTEFVKWVQEDWEGRNHFLEKRVSKTAVDEAVKDGLTPPPGTSYSTTRVVQINRG